MQSFLQTETHYPPSLHSQPPSPPQKNPIIYRMGKMLHGEVPGHVHQAAPQDRNCQLTYRNDRHLVMAAVSVRLRSII